MNLWNFALRCAVVGVLLFFGALGVASAGDITVVTMREGEPVAGIEVEAVSAMSGAAIRSGRTGSDGTIRFEGLEEGSSYQVQTKSGMVFSESVEVGSTVELELGAIGWYLAGVVGFTVGSSSATFTSDAGLDSDEAGAGGGPEFGLIVFAPKSDLLFATARPFLETRAIVSVLQPEGFEDDLGGEANVGDIVRWTIGGGVSIPVEIASKEVLIEPSVHYALTLSELSSEPDGFDERTKKFESHAIDIGLGASIPVGMAGPVGLSVDAGLIGHFPVAGSAKILSDLEGEPGIDVAGRIALRGSFEQLFGTR